MSGRLDKNFVNRYRGKTPNWGAIGEIIYLRTYSRWLPELRRREQWHETVERAVNYSLSLGPTEAGEGEELFDNIFNLRAFPAGRTLWIGDTPISYEHPEANMNCSFEDFDDAKAMHDMVLLLMSGSGVGYRVTGDVILRLNKNLPLPRRKPELFIGEYNFVGYNSPQYTDKTEYTIDDGTARIKVGDSREGWADAVMAFMQLISDGVRRLEIDINSIRPVGERLSRFGGYASGPEPLREFFVYSLLVMFDKYRPQWWLDTKALDIGNLIARMVVSGGTRRSALIALGDTRAFADAKVGKWVSPESMPNLVEQGGIPEGLIPPWRSQSNNSLLFFERPSKGAIEDLLGNVLNYGEPGILNGAAASKRRPNFRGGNPCLEILLDDHGFCNLSTVNIASFAGSDGKFDMAAARRAFELITRHTMRITNVDISERLHEWDVVQKRDRLIGVSMTGIMDAASLMGVSYFELAESGFFSELRDLVDATAESYAQEMGITKPLLRTTIKPEGTLSLLPGVSSGIHDAYAPYYIRRVRISASDAVAKALVEMGFEHEEDMFAPNTVVFSFPVKSPALRSANDVPALEALERYKSTMLNWTEHNTSVTVSLDEGEVPAVRDWLFDNWNDVIGVSFLRKATSVYPQQPYEEITEEEYNRMVEQTPRFDRSVLDRIEGAVQLFMAVDDIEADCDSGHCPVR